MMIYSVSTMAAACCFVTLGSMSTLYSALDRLVAQMALRLREGRERERAVRG